MKARFRVVGRLDAASKIQEGTVVVSRTNGTFAVRPLRRRREYVLPLSTVAEIVCQRIIKAEVAERKAQHRQRRNAAAWSTVVAQAKRGRAR